MCFFLFKVTATICNSFLLSYGSSEADFEVDYKEKKKKKENYHVNQRRLCLLLFETCKHYVLAIRDRFFSLF